MLHEMVGVNKTGSTYHFHQIYNTVKPGDFLWLGASASEAKDVVESGRGALLKIAEHVRSFGIGENGGGHGLCG